MTRKMLVVMIILTAFALLSGLAAAPAPHRSAALTPTVTPTPAKTAGAGGTSPVFDAWCLPKGTVLTRADLEKTTKPANARLLQKAKDGTPELITQNDGCIVTFTFAQAAPEEIKLEVYDMTNVRWLTAALKPTSDAKMVSTVLTHTYIVDPPLWSVGYTLKLVDASGAVLWSSPLNLKRGYTPATCWDGSWPDVATFTCYYPPDAHPWDAWYKAIPPKP